MIKSYQTIVKILIKYQSQRFIAAKNEGFDVDARYDSCRSDDPELMARKMRESFGKNIISKVWLYPQVKQTANPKCSWENYNPLQNCKYFQDLVSAVTKYGFSANVMTSINAWQWIFKSDDACPEVAKGLLWWLPNQDEQDGQPDFEYYEKFGGWQAPYMKFYDLKFVCNELVFINYYK